jgi:hypothetical protein
VAETRLFLLDEQHKRLITIIAMHPYAGIIRIRFIGYYLSLALAKHPVQVGWKVKSFFLLYKAMKGINK